MTFKKSAFLQPPKPVRRFSQATGLLLAIGWLGYVAYISVTESLGWPPGDEQLSIALVAVAVFAAGWLSVLLAFRLVVRLHSRYLPGQSRPWYPNKTPGLAAPSGMKVNPFPWFPWWPEVEENHYLTIILIGIALAAALAYIAF